MQRKQTILPLDPRYRFALKSQILATGFRSQREFCEAVRANQGVMSQIVNGTLTPHPALQKRMAETLGLTLNELRGLL